MTDLFGYLAMGPCTYSGFMHNFGRVFDTPDGMKKIHCSFFLIYVIFTFSSYAQEYTLQKGIITDSLKIGQKESYAIYIPTDFTLEQQWPLVVVCDMQGRGKRAVSMFKNVADKHGFILAGSNNLKDSTSIANNILVLNRLTKKLGESIPIDSTRIYSAGHAAGARFASLVPSFIKQYQGSISFGAAIPNYELLTSRNRYHFIGVVGNEDFSYPDMLKVRPTLKRLKFPNQLWVYDGGDQWPDQKYFEQAFTAINLQAMSAGSLPKDTVFIQENYGKELQQINVLLENRKFLEAYDYMDEVISIYQVHLSVDSLLERRKQLRKDKTYRAQRRNENAALFKETLIREEYQYNLLEDVNSLNYNNLGWWNYQVGELKKYEKKSTIAEQKMGQRLINYLNALLEDNIDIEQSANPVDDEVVSFLWMLKTITEPDNFDYYLKIISDSAKYEDFGTALFYLEELLKQGYKDKDTLYALENTALLRITPEFNDLISKYLKESRYEIIEE